MPSRPLPADRLADLLASDRGLSEAEAAERRARFGSNDILEAPPGGWRDLLRDTARDPMIWFLVGVALLFALLGDYVEAAVLAAALLPLAGMDAYLHRRTRASTEGLASRLAASATVRRDGGFRVVPARELVPGDLVEVAPAEAFPADGLVVSGAGLQVDESSLTGEAAPMRKRPLPAEAGLPGEAAAAHWGFAGTRLLAGRATLRVAYTGGSTLYGEIVRSALAGSHARTPLQQAIGRLVTVMLAAALAFCTLLAAIRLVQGHGLVDALISAVTLGVAALPEEFPVVFTVFLGVGVYRLARRQALVRRAVAVENVGRVTCICSDKTGTLTEGRLELSHAVPAEDLTVERLVGLAALAARADSGDPLDAALLATASPGVAAQRLAGFAFTEQRRRETAVLRLPDGTCLAVVKGAPETVFERCADPPAALAAWRERVTAYATTGHKVIACASRPLRAGEPAEAEPEAGYRLAGLLAFEDRLREGVREAVDDCRRAGIRVVMVTGDHPATAEAIAREIGLGGDRPTVVGADAFDAAAFDAATLDAAGGAPAGALLAAADVVARAAPAQKLALVQALQRAGEIVAVTGDGVNDVPALQAADIGIAMGERGTQSAREVAAIVLLDDNFRTIVRAVAEGRQLFLNLQLSFAYLLLIHIPLVLSAALVPLIGHPLLYLPIHIVWLELIIHPTAMLVFQQRPGSGRLLPTARQRRPRFFGPATWLALGLGGLALALIVTFGFERALGPAQDVGHARAMALGALIAAGAAVTVVLGGPATRIAAIVVSASLASLGLLVQVPALARLVHLSPLHLADWGLAAAAAVVAGLAALAVAACLRRSL
ncbi:Ca2+-transporting ATPase [Tistlia consotensis]|uniref:Ca2+-transporting ATPase n=1 Tax=Tistlia consotensis USBA 355 TaxID=560819 RepID=A0A1Y6BHN0_9PROT|nr:cation-transporting P-type ATPase [Tistlia consotensis]SMF07980.1 Ca2+-transporting ATPase [Tistlia consotensis USBA 355]SNR35598.1 Ca2+-transporting ATPase [Tistlia consotensis]